MGVLSICSSVFVFLSLSKCEQKESPKKLRFTTDQLALRGEITKRTLFQHVFLPKANPLIEKQLRGKDPVL